MSGRSTTSPKITYRRYLKNFFAKPKKQSTEQENSKKIIPYDDINISKRSQRPKNDYIGVVDDVIYDSITSRPIGKIVEILKNNNKIKGYVLDNGSEINSQDRRKKWDFVVRDMYFGPKETIINKQKIGDTIYEIEKKEKIGTIKATKNKSYILNNGTEILKSNKRKKWNFMTNTEEPDKIGQNVYGVGIGKEIGKIKSTLNNSYVLNTGNGIYKENMGTLWDFNRSSQPNKNPPFDTMLKIMKERLDIEKERLDILNKTGYTDGNNVIVNENLGSIEINSKKISNQELNEILKNDEEKAKRYIKILELDVEEYCTRYRKHRSEYDTLKEIEAKIKIFKASFKNILEKTIQNGKYSDIKKKLVVLTEMMGIPMIYFDLFRTRKEVRKFKIHYASTKNIDITLMNTNNNKTNEHLKNLENSPTKLNNNSIINKLGLEKIVKYNVSNNSFIIGKKNIYQELANEIINYMVNIDIEKDKLIDPLFLRHKEYSKIYISYLLLSSFNSNEGLYKYLKNERKIFSHGYAGYSGGIIFLKNNNILKYEDLKFKLPTGFLNNRPKYVPKTIFYLFNNFEVFTLSIQSLIQNYLYELNSNYIPKIINYAFSYEDGISLTIMENAFSVNNINKEYVGTFGGFIQNTKYGNNNNYIKNILLILKKICNIMNIYQTKCFFVHGDFHVNNIIIKCTFDDDFLINDLNVKLIDFRYSSVILNINGELKIFADIGYSSYLMIEQNNPLVSKIWNKIDLIYFLATCLFFYKKNTSNYIEVFLSKLLDIFGMNDNVRNILNKYEKLTAPEFFNFINLFKTKSALDFLKNKNNNFKNFIPENLEKYLDEYLRNLK